MVVKTSTFDNSYAIGEGGAIHAGNVQVLQSSFNNCNSGDFGGAVVIRNGEAVIEECDFTYCATVNSGGCLYSDHGLNPYNLTVVGSQFDHCSCSRKECIGGAITVNEGNDYFSITDSSITSSFAASGFGGGIAVVLNNNHGVISDVMISNTSAHTGGAIYVAGTFMCLLFR